MNFIRPEGTKEISSIILSVVRAALVIYLLSIDKFIGAIVVVLFLVSVARHLLVAYSGPMHDNIYNFLLDLITPCLYGFLIYHALSVYQADLISLAVSVLLPAFLYVFLFAREPGQGMSKGIFLGGMFCYVAMFLFIINFSFDRSLPAVEKYFIAKKSSISTGSDHQGDKGEEYYFNLIPVDSNIPFQKKVITEEQYAQFEKGDTFHIERHKGLLGISWTTYSK